MVTRWFFFFFLRCVFLANLESHSEAEMVRVLTPYGIGSFTTSAHRQETVNLNCVGWWVLKETSGPEEVGGGGGVTGDVFPMKPPWKFFVSWWALSSQPPKYALATSLPSTSPIPTHSYPKLRSHTLPFQLCPPEEEKLSREDKRGPGRLGEVRACGHGLPADGRLAVRGALCGTEGLAHLSLGQAEGQAPDFKSFGKFSDLLQINPIHLTRSRLRICGDVFKNRINTSTHIRVTVCSWRLMRKWLGL